MSNPHSPKPSQVALWVALLHGLAVLLLSQTPSSQIKNESSEDRQPLVMVTLPAPATALPQAVQQPPTKEAQSIAKPTVKPENTPKISASKAHLPPEPLSASSNAHSDATDAPPISTIAATQPGLPNSSSQNPEVVQPSSSAAYLNNPKPPYPALSRRLNEQGLVVVRVLINTEGKAEQTELFKTSGYSRLDESALKTVKQWRFVAGTRNGVPQAMWFNVPINFVLE